MSPEDKVAQLNVRRFPRIALEEPPPIGEPDDDQPETVVIDGVVKRVTTFKSLNARFAILQAPGSPSLYVSRPDFLPITDEDLKRRLAAEVVVTGSKDGRQPISRHSPFGRATRSATSTASSFSPASLCLTTSITSSVPLASRLGPAAASSSERTSGKFSARATRKLKSPWSRRLIPLTQGDL